MEVVLDRASRQSTTDFDESAVPLRIVESEEAEENRANEQKEKRESKEKKRKEEKQQETRAKEMKLKEDRQSEANKKKEKEEKDAKKKKKDKNSKESNATQQGVSPRRASQTMQHLCAPRKDRAKRATPIRESLTLVEHVEEQQQAISRSPRFRAVHPIPPENKSAKPDAMTSSVATKTRVMRPLGLVSAAEAPRIGKAAKALSVK